MKKQILVSILCLASFSVFAQSFTTAGGIRIGKKEAGITIDQRIFKNVTIEGMFNTNFKDFEVSVFAKQHKRIIFKNFTYFYGLGFHKGWEKDLEAVNPSNPFGIDGIVGLGVSFKRVNFSLDYQPGLNFNAGADDPFLEQQFGFSGRYILFKQKKAESFSFGGNKSKTKKSKKNKSNNTAGKKKS